MKTLDVEQRSEQWYAARRGMPTCSRFDMILTPVEGKPAKAQNTLINQLLSESILPPEQGVIKHTSEEMYEGMRLEGEARCAFDLEYAKEPVKEVGFIIHESGLFGGSPDALVGDDSGVEIKVPSGPVAISYIRGGVLPPEYRCQLHGYMIVTGRKSWSFFSYSRSLPAFHLLVKWDEFTDRLQMELFNFAEKYNAARVQFGLPKLGNK